MAKNGNTVSAKMKSQVVRQQHPCSIQGCWQPARTSGLCPACYSGMRRLLKRGLAYINTYQDRVRRFQARTVAASSELRSVAALPTKKRKAA